MDLEKSNYEEYQKYSNTMDILSDANKALCVIFIVLILIVNLLLMIKFMTKGNFLFNPKSSTIISMAIGDVFLALFALTLKAEVFFKGFDSLSCASIRSAWAYTNYLLNFVYGMGLITLAVEIVYRYKTQVTSRTKTFRLVSSLLFSSAPWVLGVVIILPMVLVNIDSVTCQSHRTHDQIKAQIMVSIMLPAIAAVLTSIVLKCQVQKTDKKSLRIEPKRKDDFRTKALEFHTSPAAPRTTRNKRFNAKEIFALDQDLKSRRIFATKMSATTQALQQPTAPTKHLQPTAPTQDLQPTAQTPNENSPLRQYSRIQSANTPNFVLTDGQYVIHATQPEDNVSPPTQSNIFQPGFVNPAFQHDHIDTRGQYNSSHEQSQKEIVYPTVFHRNEVILGAQNTQVATLVPLSTSERVSEHDQYRIHHLPQYPVQTDAHPNSNQLLYPILPQQNSQEPYYPVHPQPNSQQLTYPTLPYPDTQQHLYHMVPQQNLIQSSNLATQSHDQHLQHNSLLQTNSQHISIDVQTQPNSLLSSDQVAAQDEYHPTVTSPPIHQYSQQYHLEPADILLEHDGRQMAPYPIYTVPQQNGQQIASYPAINTVPQQNGQQLAPYPINTVPQQNGQQVAPYPINTVPQQNGQQMAPYPINTVPQQNSQQVAPYPIYTVPQQNGQQIDSYPINTVPQQNGQQVAPYPINTLQQQNGQQVAPYPINTAQQQNGQQVAPYPINTVPQQNGQQMAPYPINTVPQRNCQQVTPHPINNVQQDNGQVAPRSRTTAQKPYRLPNSTNIKRNRLDDRATRVTNDEAIPRVQVQVGNGEKSHLLATSIFFFILVMPFAIFDISQPEMAVTSLLVVKEIVTWLMVSRSVVTPCIMYYYARN